MKSHPVRLLAAFSGLFQARLSSRIRRRRLLAGAIAALALPGVASLQAATAPYAWGINTFGELGNNVPGDTAAAVAVVTSGVLAGKTLTATSVGLHHSLALASDGTVYAWGYNHYGQLGNNSIGDSPVPVAVDMTGVLAGKTVTAISAGDNFSMALTSEGKVYVWGYNGYGALGNNSPIYSQSQVPVAVDTTGVLAGKTVTAIAAGSGFCLALTSDSRIYAWGTNGEGELGWSGNSLTGLPVATDMSGALNGKTVTAIAAGGTHSMALTSDGQVFTWGNNNLGQLGTGTSAYSVSTPSSVSASGMLAGKTITAIAAGGYHSLVLASDGTLYTWGNGDRGQLGNGSQNGSPTPVAVISNGALAGVTPAAIAAQYADSFVLSSTGVVYGWGTNSYGELGTTAGSSSGYSAVPVAVDTSGLLSGLTVTTISTGSAAQHSIVMANQSTPVITTQPSDVTVTAGGGAQFTVVANGGTLTYQWYKGSSAISGATNATFTIPTTVTGDAGFYHVTVTNAVGTVSSNTVQLTVNPSPLQSQTVNFPALPNHVFGDAPFTVSATATSGLAVTFSITSGPATVSGNTVTITGAGTVTVQAMQAGNGSYSPATASQSFNVAAAPATVSLSNLLYLFDGNPKSVTVTTVPAGLTTSVTYNGSATAPSAIGSYTVNAVVTNANYTGSASGTLVISATTAPQTISFPPISDKAFGTVPFAISATASSGLPVTFSIVSGPATVSGSTITLTGMGTVTVMASQAGNGSYASASATQSFNVAAVPVAVTLGNLVQTYDGTPKWVTTTTNPKDMQVTVTYNGSRTAPTAIGTYSVFAIVANLGYNGTARGTLTITAQPAPVITLNPQSQPLPFGGCDTLTVAASSPTALSYQWQRDGSDIPGATSTSFVASLPGTYTATATNAGGSATSQPAVLGIASRLANLSARARVGSGGSVLIPGFVVSAPAGGTKRLLVRAIGPGLAGFGVTGVLAHPQLTVISKGNAIATNTAWNTAANPTALAAAADAVGAFALTPGSADSAVLIDVPSGAYSVMVKGADEGTGIALAEVYEVNADSSQLINLAARFQTTADAASATVGFVVAGTAPAKVLVRAVGPTLAAFGVSNPLAAPQLTIVSSGKTVASNAGWNSAGNAADIAAAASATGAFALPAGSTDSAAYLTLAPGNYSAQVSGVAGATGVVLVEVYQAP